MHHDNSDMLRNGAIRTSHNENVWNVMQELRQAFTRNVTPAWQLHRLHNTDRDTIEAWVRCQGQWMYLQPIFDSPDIMKQMPGEAKRFKNVNSAWKEIINGTKAIPNVLKSCTRENIDLKERFEMCNIELDKVQFGLIEYLESKRAVFARFYFLSNDDLLEILSQTKEVENVRPHLRKVFENMNDLEFQIDKTITAMMSGEKERVEWI